MSFTAIQTRLDSDGVVILDGGTGTELERRGVPMSFDAWCGAATLDHLDTLEAIHRDYITAGAEVITANTYASSRLMLGPAGLSDRFGDINRAAVAAAHRSIKASGRADVAVAGSLSHMVPMLHDAAQPDRSRMPSHAEMEDAFNELAQLHREEGCDLIVLEMMHHPDRMSSAFATATATGLPVWAGFSARRDEDGKMFGFSTDVDIAFEDTVKILADFDVAVAGIMHTPPNLIGDALSILRNTYDGPLSAYPDSGYFKMPKWQFEDVIPPAELFQYAKEWVANGVQVVGGCCGLSPEHIAAIAPLKV